VIPDYTSLLFAEKRIINTIKMKHKSLLVILLIMTVSYSYAKDYRVSSPDGKITVTVNPATGLNWSVTYDGKEVISSAKAGMVLVDGIIPVSGEKVRKATPGKINEVLETVVAYKRSKIEDNCNTLLIAFRSGVAVQFRAYNDGVAYRFETSFKDDITVRNEIADLQFPAG
jgi:alpha-glucosidase